LEEKFAQLLSEAVHRIRLREAKTIQAIQDELGYALGREGGSTIEYWRKGHLPPSLEDLEKLAYELARRAGLGREWLEQFLVCANHPYPGQFCEQLFPVEEAAPAWAEVASPAGSPEMGLNPFIVGPPIVEPGHFFGRSYELRRIFGLWRRVPLQNVAIIGPKRGGKTSLLHCLKGITRALPEQLRPGQRGEWLPQPERYVWVFVDFQDARMCQRERLLRFLLTSMAMPIPEPCDLENFMDVVSMRLERPTIILMDEISSALASAELDEQFWGSLRSLGSNLTGGNLAFVLTSHEAPAQLAEERGKPSPFFNIFGHTFKLGPLAEAEARELISCSPRPFSLADVNWILAQSGCWPFLVQILCHARLTALDYGLPGEAWKREGMRQMAPYWYLAGN
jgi:hypothetical protein